MPGELDEMAVLKKLARDADPRVRLRAIDLILSWQRKVPTPTVEDTSTGYADFIDALSPDELQTITDALARIREVKDAVYLRRPELRPSHWRLPDPPEPEPSRVEKAAERVAAPVARPKERKPRVQPVVAAATEPTTLPRALWAEVGIEDMNGVAVHSLGDAHAQAILDGTIPFADAKAEHDAAMAHGRRLSDAILSQGD